MFEKLRSLFGGEKEVTRSSSIHDYSQMVVDIHSHLIPGIDDGVKTMEESVSLIKSLHELGFKKLITSPHVLADGYRNTPEIILGGRDRVREAIKEAGIDIQFDATAEYNIDEGMYEKIEKRELLSFGHNYIMVEMPFISKPAIMGDIIYKLQIAGYNVILAHPERYGYFYENDFSSYNSLKDRNVLFQINIASLIGTYGKPAKFSAEKMINENMVNFIGTDLHGQRHLKMLRECLNMKYLEKIITYDKLLNKTLL